MARAFPTEIIEAMTASRTDKIFLAILTISHPNFDTIRLVNNTENVTSDGEDFVAFPFSAVLPPDDEESPPFLEINIMNADLSIVEQARTIAGLRERAQATLAIIEHSDPDTKLAEYSNYEIPAVSYDENTLSFRMVVESFLSEPFPARSFTPGSFPGLF